MQTLLRVGIAGALTLLLSWQSGAFYQSRDSNYNVAISSGGSWTPASLGANLVGWWDSSVIGSLFQNTACTTAVTTSGQSVQCVQDQSGNGLTALYSASAATTYTSSAFNTHAALVAGASLSELATGNTSAFASLSAASVCWTGILNSFASGSYFGGIGASPNSTANAAVFYLVDTSGNLSFDYDFGTYNPQAVTTSTHYDFCQVYNAGAVATYINGSAAGTGAPTNFSFSASAAPLYPLFNAYNQTFAEEFMAKTNISSTVASQYHTYRVNKWGS